MTCALEVRCSIQLSYTGVSNDQSNPSSVSAALLAGGRSARFGSDKARATVGDGPLILQNLNHLRTAFDPVWVVGPPPNTYADLGLTCVADAQAHQGPMAGVITALTHRRTQLGEGVCVVVACDTLLDRPHVAALAALAEELAPREEPRHAAAPRGERWQPVFAAYHTRALPSLTESYAAGNTSLTRWLDAPDTAAYPAAFEGLKTFNTSDELTRAQKSGPD